MLFTVKTRRFADIKEEADIIGSLVESGRTRTTMNMERKRKNGATVRCRRFRKKRATIWGGGGVSREYDGALFCSFRFRTVVQSGLLWDSVDNKS